MKITSRERSCRSLDFVEYVPFMDFPTKIIPTSMESLPEHVGLQYTSVVNYYLLS